MSYSDLIMFIEDLERVAVTMQGHRGPMIPDGVALVWCTCVVLEKQHMRMTYQTVVP